MMPARICVLQIEGTNCELETFRSFKRLGAAAEIVHLKQLIGAVKEREKRKLKDYDLLVIPGGFSSGDYIRAGAILAARIRGTLGEDIDDFIRDGKPILGICNGFQVLVEMGLLPGLADEKIGLQQAALTTNDSARFECRSVYLRQENRGNCVFTKGIENGHIMKMPCAHAEGKFFISEKRREAYLQLLEENDQIVFRYIDPEGGYASYPWNPNGSVDNIAGICDPSGIILGLMPHPERAFYAYLDSEWSRRAKGGEEGRGAYGDGKAIFEAVLNYLSRKAYI